MTEKFNVGDKVYDIRLGVGIITTVRDKERVYPLDVEFIGEGSHLFTACGRFSATNINPTLFTISAARARGYDVPKEKVKKTETQYCLVFNNGTISGQRFKSRASAEEHTREYDTTVAIAECVFTWEEEI